MLSPMRGEGYALTSASRSSTKAAPSTQPDARTCYERRAGRVYLLGCRRGAAIPFHARTELAREAARDPPRAGPSRPDYTEIAPNQATRRVYRLKTRINRAWRGGRAVECGGLENR